MFAQTVNSPPPHWSNNERPGERRTAEERARDSATAQLQAAPETPWIRKRWLDAVKEKNWEFLPEDIAESVARGRALEASDLEAFSRVSQGRDLHSAVAATRLLGLLAEDYAQFGVRFAPVLEEVLSHEFGRVRAAAAEALWSADLKASAQAIREAAEREQADSIREHMLHLAELLARP